MHARIFAAFAELYGIMAVITCDLSTSSNTGSGAACLSTVLFPNTDFLGLQPKGDDAICACRSAGPISTKDRPRLLLVVSSVVSAGPILQVIRYNKGACSHTYRSGRSNEGGVWWFHLFLPRGTRGTPRCPQQCRLVARDRACRCRRSTTSMIDGNAGYATRQSRRSFGAKMSRANFIERYTVKLIEQDSRVNNHFRWCAYTGMFKSKELFAPQQLLARAELRFCEDFASPALRASKTPGLTMNAQAIAWAAATLNITLTDVDGEVGGAAIGPGAGSRDEHANEHAGPQVPEEIPSWLEPAVGQAGSYQVVIPVLTALSVQYRRPPLRIIAEWMHTEDCYDVLIESNCSTNEMEAFLVRAGILRPGGGNLFPGWKKTIREETFKWVDFLKAERDAEVFAARQNDKPDAAGSLGLSFNQIKAALSAERLSFIGTPKGSTGFEKVFMIKSGTHEGKFIAVGYDANGNNYSLGIFHSSHEAALSYARFAANHSIGQGAEPAQEEAARAAVQQSPQFEHPELRAVIPSLLPAASTIASHGPAGLGVSGVGTVDTGGAALPFVSACVCTRSCGVGNTDPHAVKPNLLPVAPTNAAHGLAGLGVLGVETVDTRGAGGGGHACICGLGNTEPRAL